MINLESYLIPTEESSKKSLDNFTNIDTKKDKFGDKISFYIDSKEIGHARTAKYKNPNDFIHDVEVKKEYRGQGYGDSIVKYMLDKYPIKYLNVAKDNTIAQNLYKKYGFKIIGEVRMDDDEIMWQMSK